MALAQACPRVRAWSQSPVKTKYIKCNALQNMQTNKTKTTVPTKSGKKLVPPFEAEKKKKQALKIHEEVILADSNNVNLTIISSRKYFSISGLLCNNILLTTKQLQC